VSCGEYGDNVRKLVTAIKNGKYDIQVGKPFPQPENLNNVNQKEIMKSKYFYTINHL
jgi:ATP-binding cassette, subfamily G (WHITE), member 1